VRALYVNGAPRRCCNVSRAHKEARQRKREKERKAPFQTVRTRTSAQPSKKLRFCFSRIRPDHDDDDDEAISECPNSGNATANVIYSGNVKISEVMDDLELGSRIASQDPSANPLVSILESSWCLFIFIVARYKSCSATSARTELEEGRTCSSEKGAKYGSVKQSATINH